MEINTETQRIITFLQGVGSEVIGVARRKCSNPKLAVGALTESGGDSADFGFSVALAIEVARHGPHFSQSTLDKVEWDRVAARFK